MRKVVFIAVIVCIILHCGFGAQMRMGEKTVTQKLTKSSLGKALLSMVQMQMKLGSSEGIEDLFDALETLKQSLIQRKEEAQVEYDADEQNHNSEESRLQNLITEYTNEIKRVDQQINDLTQTIQTLEQDLSSQSNQLGQVQQGAQDEIQTLTDLETQYRSDYNDYSEAIELLNQAIAKVQEAQEAQKNSEEEGVQAVFLQTNMRTFKHISEGLQKNLKKLSKGMLVQPLVTYFSQLSSSAAQLDPSSLERVLDALANLRDYYIQGQQDLATSYEQVSELHQSLLIQFQNQAANLQNIIIPQTNSQLESNKGSLTAKQDESDTAKLNLQHEQEQLVLEQESWKLRVDAFEELLPQYDEQLQVVEQAENIIKAEYAFF